MTERHQFAAVHSDTCNSTLCPCYLDGVRDANTPKMSPRRRPSQMIPAEYVWRRGWWRRVRHGDKS